MTSAISFGRATLALGGRIILSEASLEIGPGEFIGVLGPNGAGKTTMMRAVLGLLSPSAGSIHVLGEPARRGDPRLGYLPQTSRAVAGMRFSGRDLLASTANGHRFGLPLQNKSIKRDVEWALELVGAQDLAARPFSELSGGERQRVLIAQALLGRPRLLLLDEPLASLDPRYQHEIIELVGRVQRELGIAVLLSAHEINPLVGTIDRVLYLGNGHAALGTVDEVITGPVLSRLYDSAIEVVRVKGRYFVMSEGSDLEHQDHGHHHDHGHGHGHGHDARL